MAVLIPRIRTLGVRLSEEEYSALEKFSIESGARSMSDVARTAICDFIRHAIRESTLSSAVSEHSMQVKDLEQKMDTLRAEIALLKGDKSGHLQGDAGTGSEMDRNVPEGELPSDS